jgi:hypothetical protein
MSPQYRLNLMFEWGGGCLWCADQPTLHRFDGGPVEESLPLSPGTMRRLQELTAWHDLALNWDYPPDPGPWQPADYAKFEIAAQEVLQTIRQELGPTFEVEYVPLG